MDNAAIKTRMAEILKWDSYEKPIHFHEISPEQMNVDLDIYAITASTAAQVAALATEAKRVCIITIQAISTPKIQIRLM